MAERASAVGGRCLRLVLLALCLPGCVTGIPARRLPKEFLGAPRANKDTIDFVRLRQDPPQVYLLGPRDILGVYIENILGSEGTPPIQVMDRGDLPPAMGYPVVVRENGTITLPLLDSPIEASGLTVAQAEEAIRKAYTIDRRLLPVGKDRIIVTLMRRRTYQVLVVREDSGGPLVGPLGASGLQGTSLLLGNSRRGTVYTLDLPAYENDVLHALSGSGGLPGLEAKNEVQIRRGVFAGAEQRDALMATLRAQVADPCCPIPPPMPEDPNVTRIPLRYGPGEIVRFTQKDIILNTGDVVFIEGRDADVFYTGGLLGGGQFQLPRDIDLDVLGAIALARGPIGGAGPGAQNSSQLGIVPPSECIVIRTTKCGTQIPIRVNFNRAITDGRERILVQPGDIVLLQYTPAERLLNGLLSTVSFNFLFNGFRGQSF